MTEQLELERPAAPTAVTGPLAVIMAHPDDESFGCAGTIASAVARGLPVTIISATRGERGETAIPAVDQPEILGAVREQELRTAMAKLGVADVRILGYWDSGMDGTPENNDSRAFLQAPRDEVVDKLVVQLRGIQPEIVITFGEDGGYGHPDHIAIHFATVEAVNRAADSDYRPELGPAWQIRALYFRAMPREALQELARQEQGPFSQLSPEVIAKLGVPENEITTRLNIAAHMEVKLAAIMSHATQIDDPARFRAAEQAEDWFRRMMESEQYVRAPLPWDDPVASTPDLLLLLETPEAAD